MIKEKRWIILFAGAIIVVLLLRSFLFTSYSIPSSGMENTLYQGDRILVNKWSYGLRVPLMSIFSYHRWNTQPVKAGNIVVFNNPASSEPVIDQRNVFISRCIGVPGDTLWIDSQLSIHSSLEVAGPDRKHLYVYPRNKEAEMDSLLTVLSITGNKLMGQNEKEHVRSFSRYEYYLLEQAIDGKLWITPVATPKEKELKYLIIPGKGKKIDIHPWNITLLRNTILLHEGENSTLRNDSLFINNQHVTSYTFSKDYYWMIANNSVNLADSRLFGFVPHDHIIGKAFFIWFSKESHSGIAKGYRWKRFFTVIN